MVDLPRRRADDGSGFPAGGEADAIKAAIAALMREADTSPLLGCKSGAPGASAISGSSSSKAYIFHIDRGLLDLP